MLSALLAVAALAHLHPALPPPVEPVVLPLDLGTLPPLPPGDALTPGEPLAPGPRPAPLILGDDTFSYTYFEVGGRVLDVDGTSEDVDSHYGRASLGLFGLFFGSVTYESQDFDLADTDADLLSLGAGAHLSLTDSMDIVGEVAWLYNDVSSDDDDLDGSESGTQISAGIRWMPFDWGGGGGLELNGGALWQDLDNRLASDESVVGWQLGVRAHVIKLVSVGADYTLLEDDDQLGLNVRVSL